jgi:arsenate reductase
MSKANVLFLCTGNSARSQMAEALLRRHGGEHFEAFSAGLEPKPIHPLTIQVMEELGIDISQQRSKSSREYLGHKYFGFLVVVCADAEEKCPVIFINVHQRLFWPFEDPAHFNGSDAERLAKFRKVRDQIDEKMRAWLAELGYPVAAAGSPTHSPA